MYMIVYQYIVIEEIFVTRLVVEYYFGIFQKVIFVFKNLLPLIARSPPEADDKAIQSS